MNKFIIRIPERCSCGPSFMTVIGVYMPENKSLALTFKCLNCETEFSKAIYKAVKDSEVVKTSQRRT